jgi:hypothetical protein
MTLREEQNLFMQLLPKLINKINETHLCSGGDLCSKPEYGAHKKNSCHFIRLAIDINLFTKDGAYLIDTMAHKPFGDFWESLHPLCRWGGRFNDGNHYSLEYEGRA